MGFLKNKHVILAMFVAPVLAIIAYFATDYVVSEKPRQAEQGGIYKLAARPNCRYQSGVCTLYNGDVEVSIRIERVSASIIKLILQANLPVQHALASFAADGAEAQPKTLYRSAADQGTWNAEFEQVDPQQQTLRLAVQIAESFFYAETPTVFIDHDTPFTRDNFSR